jgi:integrase
VECSSVPEKRDSNWIGYTESGKASYYAMKFQSKKTASGELYDKAKKTAAHKKLPRGLHNDYVFLFRGKPIKDIRDGLMRGCKDAGIPYGRKVKNGFTFHDLRHTAKTFMRKAGVDKNVRAVIFGHSINGDMDFRYDHVDEADLLDAIDRTETFLQSVSKNVSKNIKQQNKI